MTANATGGSGTYTYSWAPANMVSNPTAQTTTASPEVTTTFTCNVTCNGQTASGSVTVIVVLPPTNVTAQIADDDKVTVNWSPADYADSYNIYRDGVLIAENITGSSYTDNYRSAGETCYQVRSNYQNHLSQDSELACVFFCVAPEDVNAEYVWIDNGYLVRLTWNKNVGVDFDIDYFRVLRGQNNDYEVIGEVENEDYVYEYSFDDTTAAVGSQQYIITAVYQNTSCEMNSEPVICEVTSLNETASQVSLFPNPTQGKVTVKAAGMSQVTVINAMGQVMLTQQVDNDETILDLSSFGNGMYMVTINTIDGVIVKKINVLR